MKMQHNPLKYNPILDADSYKLSHSLLYPRGIKGMYSYCEARTKGNVIVPFGLQMWIKKTLGQRITTEHINEAAEFAMAHGEPFDPRPWERIVSHYDGYLPVTIRGLPEGTIAKDGLPLYSVVSEDEDLLAFLSSYFETTMQRGVWYPTTIASEDYKRFRIIKRYLAESADSSDGIAFMLHDFGGRGVSSEETAQIGGAAHLVYFMGSDTISGVRAANHYYNMDMAAFSVPATEHSVQCSYGSLYQKEYLEAVLDLYAKPGAIVSIVLDGYDVYREATTLCTDFKQKIIDSGAKVVMRPDSGDPLEVIPRLLEIAAINFGYDVNSKGYKVLKHVAIIQGDGINTEMIEKILDQVTGLGYSAENLVFGSGGALLQKVNRDTFKFAQKASAIKRGGVWHAIAKDPITDPGKTSKAGRVGTGRNAHGVLVAINYDKPLPEGVTDAFITFYDHGELMVDESLTTIRLRAKA